MPEQAVLTDKKALKQKRKAQIINSKGGRYFTLVAKLMKSTAPTEGDVEGKVDFETNFIDKTSDYNKYLNENPKDTDKWLEFIGVSR